VPSVRRPTAVTREVRAGCVLCGAEWKGGSAQGSAARHTDVTDHETWVEVEMTIRYGGRPSAGRAPKPAAKKTMTAREALRGFVGLPRKS
jgi:hypothetical protein